MKTTTVILFILVVSIMLLGGAAILATFKQTSTNGINQIRLRYYAVGIVLGALIMWSYQS